MSKCSFDKNRKVPERILLQVFSDSCCSSQSGLMSSVDSTCNRTLLMSSCDTPHPHPLLTDRNKEFKYDKCVSLPHAHVFRLNTQQVGQRALRTWIKSFSRINN